MSKKHTSTAASFIPQDSIANNKDFQAFEAQKQQDAARIAGPQDSGLRATAFGLQHEASEYDRLLQNGDFGGGPADLDGRLGDRQSAWKQWANGIARFAPIVGTKMMNSVLGAKNAVKEFGTGFDGSSFVDDEMTEAVTSWEDSVKEFFPIYAKSGYNEGSLGSQMMTAKFWADEALDGVAFMAAQAGIMYATGGAVGALGKAAGIAGTAANAGKIAQLAATGAKTLGYGAMSAMQEAAIEAHGSGKSVQDQLEGTANPETGAIYTKEEIKQRAAQAAASTFSANSAALLLPAMWEARIIMGLGKRAVAKGISSAAKNAVKAGAVTATDLIQGVGASALHKSGTRAIMKGAAVGFAVEGLWEENIQHAIQHYDVDNAVNGNTPGLTRKTMEYAEGMLDNLTTKEGQKAIVLGGIIGGPMGGYGARGQAKAYNEQADRFVESLAAANRTMLDNTKSYLKTDENGNLELDENGQPQVDEKAAMKLTQQVMTTKRLADKHAMAALQGNEQLMKLNADISIGSAVWNAATNKAFESPEEGVTFLKWHHEQILREQGEQQDEAVDTATAESTEDSQAKTEAKTAVKKSTAKDQAYTSGVINQHLMNVDKMVAAFKEVETRATDLNKVDQDPSRTEFNEVLKKGMFYERIKQNSIEGMITEKQAEKAVAARDRVDPTVPTLTEAKIDKEIEGLSEAMKDSKTKYNQYHEQPEVAYDLWNAPQAQARELTKQIKGVREQLTAAKEGEDVSSLQDKEKELVYMLGELNEKEGPAFKNSRTGEVQAMPRESIITQEQADRVQQQSGRRYTFYEKAATGVKAIARIQQKMEDIQADTATVLKQLNDLMAMTHETAEADALSAIVLTPEVRNLVSIVEANFPILDKETIAEVQQTIDQRAELVPVLEALYENLDLQPGEAYNDLAGPLQARLTNWADATARDVRDAKDGLDAAASTSEKKQDLFSPAKIEDHLTEEIAREYNAKGEHVLSIAMDPNGEVKEDFYDVRSTEAAIEQASLMRGVINSRATSGDLQNKAAFTALVKETDKLIAKLNLVLAVAKSNKSNREAKQADINQKAGQQLIDLLTTPGSKAAEFINATLDGKLDALIEEARQQPGVLHEAMTALLSHALAKMGSQGREDLDMMIQADQLVLKDSLQALAQPTPFVLNTFVQNPDLAIAAEDIWTALSLAHPPYQQPDTNKTGLRARLYRDNDVYDILTRIQSAPADSLVTRDKDKETEFYKTYQSLSSLAKLRTLANTDVSSHDFAVKSRDQALVEDGGFSPTSQQDQAVRELSIWLANPLTNKNNWAYLRGIAGTGKTNVVFKWMLKLASGLQTSEIVTASNLKSAAGVVAKAAGTDALTYEELMLTDLTGKKLVVIDEYGTLTEEQMKVFRAKVVEHNKGTDAKVKVMILGDPTQISPSKTSHLDITTVSSGNKEAAQMTVITPLTVVYRSDVSAINELSDIFQAETAIVENISGRSNKAVGESGAIGVQTTTNSDSILQTIAGNIADPAAKNRTRAIIVEDQAAVDKYNAQLEAQNLSGVQVLSVYDAQSMTFEEVYVDLPVENSPASKPEEVKKANTKMYTAVSRAKEFAMVVYPSSKNVVDDSLMDERDTNINQQKEAREEYYKRKAQEVKMFENLQAGSPLNENLEEAAKTEEAPVAPADPADPADPAAPVEDSAVEEDEDQEFDEDEETVTEDESTDQDENINEDGSNYEGGEINGDSIVNPLLQDTIPNIDKKAYPALKNGSLKVGDKVFYVHAETPSSVKRSNINGEPSVQIFAQTEAGDLVLIGQMFQTELPDTGGKPLLTRAEVNAALKANNPALLQAGIIKEARISEAQHLHMKYNANLRQGTGIVQKLKDSFKGIFPTDETRVTFHIFPHKKKGDWAKLGIPDTLVGKPIAIVRPQNAEDSDFTNAKFVELKARAIREDEENVVALRGFHKAVKAIEDSLPEGNMKMGREVFERAIRAMKGAFEITNVGAKLDGGNIKGMTAKTTPLSYDDFRTAYVALVTEKNNDADVQIPMTEAQYLSLRDQLMEVSQGYYGVGKGQVKEDVDGVETTRTIAAVEGGKGYAQVAFNRLAKANEYVGGTRIRQAVPVGPGKLRNTGKSLMSTINSDTNVMYPLMRAVAIMKGAGGRQGIANAINFLRKELKDIKGSDAKIEHLQKVVEGLNSDVQKNMKVLTDIIEQKRTPPVTSETLGKMVNPENFTQGEHRNTYTDSEGNEKPAFMRRPFYMPTFNKQGQDPEANAAYFENSVYTNFESVAPTRIRVSYEAMESSATVAPATMNESDADTQRATLREQIKEAKAKGEDVSALMEELKALRRTFNAATHNQLPDAALSLQEARTELQRLIPGISEQEMAFVDKMILNQKALPGEDLLGLFTKGKIYLALDANGQIPRSVLRHEAFHKIFNQYLSAAERTALKQELDPNNQLSLSEFDEQLADRFMDYRSSPESFSKKVAAIFNKIMAWLGFARNNEVLLTQLFRDIEAGKFTKPVDNNSTVRRAFNNIAKAFGNSMTYKAALALTEGKIKHYRTGDLTKIPVLTKQELKARVRKDLTDELEDIRFELEMNPDDAAALAEVEVYSRLLQDNHFDRLWKTIYQGYSEGEVVSAEELITDFDSLEEAESWLGDLIADADNVNEEGSATDRVKDAVSFIEYRKGVVNPRKAYALILKLLAGTNAGMVDFGQQIKSRAAAMKIKERSEGWAVMEYLLNTFATAEASRAVFTLQDGTRVDLPLTDNMKFAHSNSFVLSRTGESIAEKTSAEISAVNAEIINRLPGESTTDFSKRIAVVLAAREGGPSADIALVQVKHLFRKYQAQQEVASVYSHFASHREAEYYKGQLVYEDGFKFRYIKAHLTGREVAVRNKVASAVETHWEKNQSALDDIFEATDKLAMVKGTEPDYNTAVQSILKAVGITEEKDIANNSEHPDKEVYAALRGLNKAFKSNAAAERKSYTPQDDTAEETISNKTVGEEIENSQSYMNTIMDYLAGDEHLQAKKMKGADGKSKFPFHLGSQALENVQRLVDSIKMNLTKPAHIKPTNIFNKGGVGSIRKIVDHDGFGWKGINFSTTYGNETAREWMTRSFGLGFLGFGAVHNENTYVQYFYTNSNKPSQKGAEVQILSHAKQRKGIQAMLDQHLQADDIIDIKGYNKYKAVNNDEVLQAFDEVMGTAEDRAKGRHDALATAYSTVTSEQKTKIVDKVLEKLTKEADRVMDFIVQSDVTLTSDLSKLTDKLKKAKVFNPRHTGEITTAIEYDGRTKSHKFDRAEFMPIVEAWVVNNYVNGYFLNDIAAGDMNYFKNGLDMGKRLSSVFGSGKKGMIGKNFMRPTARVAIIDDPKFTSESLSKALKGTSIAASIEKNGIDLADAQGYMTPRRKEELIKGFGEEYGAGDIFKPIYSGTYKRQVTLRDKSSKEVEVPAILKDSVVVLTDELVRQQPLLLELRNEMDRLQVDEAVMASGAKEGAPSKMSTSTKLTPASVLEIDNDKYRLQLNPISKPFKEKGTSIPTQLIYIINTMNNTGENIEENQAKIDASNNIYSALSELYKDGLAKFKKNMLTDSGKVKSAALAATMDPASSERLIAMLDEGADFNLSMLADKVYSQVANALTKFTTRIKFPGGKLIQQSSMGIQYIDPKTGVARNLEFKEEKGQIWAEVLLPEAYRDHTDLGSYLLPDGLSYRIPSTGYNSAVGFKVVGYYPSKGKGANIIVGPAEIVTQMGSDFDVDSMFVITRAKHKGIPVGYAKQGSKLVFDPAAYQAELSKVEGLTERDLADINEKLQINVIVENLLFLTSTLTNKDRITDTVSTDEIVSILKDLKLDTEVHVNMSLPMSNMDFHQSNFQGLKLTGIFANISKSLAYMVNAGKSKGSVAYPQMRKSVTVGDKTYREFSEKSAEQTQDIWQTLSGLVNSAVDNVKEQQLYKMNASNLTGKMYGAALAMGMPLRTTVMLMTQPVMRLASASGKMEVAKAKLIEALRKADPAYAGMKNADIIESIKDTHSGLVLTEAALLKNLKGKDNQKAPEVQELSLEDLKVQLAVIEEAGQLDTIGTDLSTFSKMISVIQGFPSTHEELQAVERAFDETLIPEGKSYKTADGFSFDISNLFTVQPNIQQAYQNMKELLQIVSNNLFKHAPMVETFVDDVLREFPIKIDYKLNRSKIKQELMSYLTATMYSEELSQEPDLEYTDQDGTQRIASGKEAWTQRFIEQHKSLFGSKTNDFLTPIAVKSKRGIARLTFSIDSNINSVEELMLSEGFEKLDPEFQQGLLKYAVLHHGMGFGYRNFSAYIAPSALQPVNDHMKQLDKQIREVATREVENLETGEKTLVEYNPLLERIKEHFGFSMVAVNASALRGFPKDQKAIPQMENGKPKTVTIKGEERNVLSGVDEYGVYYDKSFVNSFEQVEEEADNATEVSDSNEETPTDIAPEAVGKVSTFPRFVRERTRTGASIFYLRTTGPRAATVKYVRLGYQSFGGYEVPSHVLQNGWHSVDYFNQPGVLPIQVENIAAASHEIYAPEAPAVGGKVIAYTFNNKGTRDMAHTATIAKVSGAGNNKYTVELSDAKPVAQRAQLSKQLEVENRVAVDRMEPAIRSLVNRFGIPVSVVSASEMPGGHADAKGMYFGGQVYLNADLMTADTAFHEVAHPIITQIRESKPAWYSDLEAEMKSSQQGKLTLAKVRMAYPELNPSEQMEEAMVTLIGEMAAGRMDQVSKLSKLIRRLMRAIGARVNAVLKEIGLPGLSPEQATNLNLTDLARVLNGEKSSLDPNLSRLEGDPDKVNLQKSEIDEAEIRLFQAGRIIISCK